MWFHVCNNNWDSSRKKIYTWLRQKYIMLACIFSFHKEHAELPVFFQVTDERAFEMDISLESVTCSSFMKRSVAKRKSQKDELKCPHALFHGFQLSKFPNIMPNSKKWKNIIRRKIPQYLFL